MNGWQISDSLGSRSDTLNGGNKGRLLLQLPGYLMKAQAAGERSFACHTGG
jgi:hypothetical protein